MNITNLKVNNTFFKLENNKFVIPNDIKQIKIDVGLAGDACNAAAWLENTNDRFVFGIEPLQVHWDHLYKMGSPFKQKVQLPNHFMVQLYNQSIMFKEKIICDISEKFCGLQCAIDDVIDIQQKDFYEFICYAGHTGASSLLKEQANLSPCCEKIEKIKVNVVSLSFILSHIPWDRFKYLEHIKTDCEGHDLSVVKSIGKYLDRIVFISSETGNNHKTKNFINFMLKNNFKVIYKYGNNTDFVNSKLKNNIIKHNLNNYTLGM